MQVAQPTASISSGKSGRPKRTTLYVQEDLQFRYSMIFVLITALGLVVGYVLPRLNHFFGSSLMSFRMVSILLIVTVFVGIIFFSLFFTHKIAGPIYRLKSFLDHALREKTLSGRVKFRQNDELHDVAGCMNRLFDDLTSDLSRSRENLEHAIEEVDCLLKKTLEEEASLDLSAFSEPLTEIHQLLVDARYNYQT